MKSCDQLAYSVLQTARTIGIGRSKLYELFRSGELNAVRCGRRTLVLASELHSFLSSLPSVRKNN